MEVTLQFMRIRDPQIYNQAGDILRDCSPDEQALEEARRLFELSLSRSNPDDPERRFPLYSLFTHYFIKHDLKTAKRYLQDASNVQSDILDQVPVGDPWAITMRNRHDPIIKELEPLWYRVKKENSQKTQ